MHIFKHNGKVFVDINGKTFFCHAALNPGYGPVCFLIVQGKTSLSKADLPTSDWHLIKVKGEDRSFIYVIYHKGHFQYENRESGLLFIAPTIEGALYLALQHLKKTFNVEINDHRIDKLVTAFAHELPNGIQLATNRGNMKLNGIYLQHVSHQVYESLTN